MHDPPEPIGLLRRMVAIPSVNPAFPDVPPELAGEARLAAFVLAWGKANGLEAREFQAAPGRPCVLLAAGPEDAPKLVVSAHLDTVWTRMEDPFRLESREGCLWGLGAVDDKGPLAAAMWTLRRLSRERLPLRLMVLATCDEECGLTGIRHMLPGQLRPDGLIVAEATGLRLVTAHKGSSRIEFRTAGRSVHSSLVPRGDNAIYKAARLVGALEDCSRELLREPPHPLLGTNTLCVATIAGGTQTSVVPDECRCSVNFRSLPGETPSSILARLEGALRKRGLDYRIAWSSFDAPPLDTPPDLPMVRRIRKALAEAGHDDAPCGIPCATEAFRAAETGCPAVVFGPGDIDTAHTPDERIELDQFLEYPELLSRIIMSDAWSKADFHP